MIKESKRCSDVKKKYFNKELVVTRKDKKDFEISTKCWICDDDYTDGDVKLKHYCQVTENTGSAHRDCIINVKLN